MNFMHWNIFCAYFIRPHDQDILLSHLSDIRFRYNRSNEYIGLTSTVELYFTPNEWFTNHLLTLKFEERPFDERLENMNKMCRLLGHSTDYVTTGCEIHWTTGKKLTLTTERHNITKKSFYESTFENKSFFDAFNDDKPINFERFFIQKFSTSSIIKLYKYYGWIQHSILSSYDETIRQEEMFSTIIENQSNSEDD
jgi:hypothetical protein